MSNASDHVYGELRRRLMAGSFLPGERLREEHIAAEMSVSRTPVRNAIERLIADGLVTREERRGAVVLGWQDRDIDEASSCACCWNPTPPGWPQATPATRRSRNWNG